MSKEVVVVTCNKSNNIIGVCSNEVEAKKLIHKLKCTVPIYFGADFDFIKSFWEIDKNIYEDDQLNNEKALIINIGSQYTCYNPKVINLDYKKFLKSKKAIDKLKLVVNSDNLIYPVIGYLSDQIEYYETEVKPEYKDYIICEKDGFIMWVDYNYDEKIMFSEAKKIKDNFIKNNV